VGEVRASPDLKVATAYVLPLGGRDPEGAVKALARAAPALRKLVARGTELKFAPELRFKVDETFDALDRTRAMFADETVARDVSRQDASRDALRGEE
jgi:ribosome-binding factor A